MIADVPRPRPLHLVKEITRHGRTVWYHRIAQGPRTRLTAEFGTAAFQAQYDAAERGEAPAKAVGRAAARVGTLRWLIDRYREVDAWRTLSPATRKQRERIFRQVCKTAGDEPFTVITDRAVAAGRDRRAGTPFEARHFLAALRGLFDWAKDAGHVAVNPVHGVKRPPKPRGSKGFPVWTVEELAAYEARWPRGTNERVWFDVLVYTGLRRGDAVRLGRQHVRSGIAHIRTEKSGEDTDVFIRLLPPLLETLRLGPTGDLAFICGKQGRPLTKESFGNEFREACRAAGVNKSAHGIRKAAATRAAENGATVAELEAMFGWRGGRMASLYTASANRRRLALAASGKLLGENDRETAIPAPAEKVRD